MKSIPSEERADVALSAHINGTALKTKQSGLHRSEEVNELIDAVKSLIIPFIRAADESAVLRSSGGISEPTKNVLVEAHKPEDLVSRLKFTLPEGQGRGREGLLDLIQRVLRYSVNTWDQGYLDKLCASTDAVGVISELLLSVLNTNAHVYHVSPALTVIEKTTARSLAHLYGLVGPRAGGFTCPGGSASNFTSLVTARGALYPETKWQGNDRREFVIFTSIDAHYSIRKAAMAIGIGTNNVILVPSDSKGSMDAQMLRALVLQAKEKGKTPLYTSATAGTTVLGAFDPLRAVSAVCIEFGMWMHVDASWGGATIFSARHKHKLDGIELADSITVNPHKMLNVPMTCSFLLVKDASVCHEANALPAGYLFHSPENRTNQELWDLADMSLQCGRRADSLKFALSWTYHGSNGFETAVDGAFANAQLLTDIIESSPSFKLISQNPPTCLQVCFYYTPGGELAHPDENTSLTREMVRKLVGRGFMVDHAPGAEGNFFRVVVNCQTLSATIKGLVIALEHVGEDCVNARAGI